MFSLGTDMRPPRYLKGVAEGEANNACPPFTYWAECVSSTHRADTGVIVCDLGFIADQHFVELHNVGVLCSKLISRAVAADDYVFCHFRPGVRLVLNNFAMPWLLLWAVLMQCLVSWRRITLL